MEGIDRDAHQFDFHAPRGRKDVDALVRILGVLVDRHVFLEPLVQRREVDFDEVFQLCCAEDEDALGSFAARGEGRKVHFVGGGWDGGVLGEVCVAGDRRGGHVESGQVKIVSGDAVGSAGVDRRRTAGSMDAPRRGTPRWCRSRICRRRARGLDGVCVRSCADRLWPASEPVLQGWSDVQQGTQYL